MLAASVFACAGGERTEKDNTNGEGRMYFPTRPLLKIANAESALSARTWSVGMPLGAALIKPAISFRGTCQQQYFFILLVKCHLMTEVVNTCINCGNTVQSPYCGQCGQRNPPKRLTFLTLYTDFQSKMYGFDGMFPRTLRDLTLVPGEVAREFLKGNRVRYVGPVGYFFVVLTLFLLLMQILEIDFYSFSKSSSPIHVEETERQKMVSKKFMEVVQSNMRIFSFLQIPISAFFAWLFFRKSRFNYLENSVLVFYVSGHLMWLSIFNLFLYIGLDLNLNIWQLLINSVFYAFACTGFYQTGSVAWKFIKGILVTVTSYLIFMLIVMIGGTFYILSNPEMMELFRESK